MTKVLLFNHAGNYTLLEIPREPGAIVALVKAGSTAQILPEASGSLSASQQGELVIITPSQDEKPVPSIPHRELQVLQQLGCGQTPAQIAYQMGLKPRTIRGYIANLKVRLDAQTGPQLLARAAVLGLLTPRPD